MDLDKKHPNPSFSYSAEETTKIWKGLRSLSSDEQLFITSQVHDELLRVHDGAHEWVHIFPCINSDRGADPEIDSIASKIMGDHRTLINVNISHLRDPADPKLIAVAMKYGYVLVTSEKGKWERSTEKSKEKIPDVCKSPTINVKCIHFPQFVNDENLLM